MGNVSRPFRINENLISDAALLSTWDIEWMCSGFENNDGLWVDKEPVEPIKISAFPVIGQELYFIDFYFPKDKVKDGSMDSQTMKISVKPRSVLTAFTNIPAKSSLFYFSIFKANAICPTPRAVASFQTSTNVAVAQNFSNCMTANIED